MVKDVNDSISRTKNFTPSVLLRSTNLCGYVFLILVNVLSSTGVWGPTNAEVSAQYPTPLTPAGWAFSIWGLIFLLQGAGAIYQALPSGYQEGGCKRLVVNQIGIGWQLGWNFQCAWQFVFVQQSQVGQCICSLLLLGALFSFASTLKRLYALETETRTVPGTPHLSLLVYLFFYIPTSINTAWLSVASAIGLLIVPKAYGVETVHLVAPAAVLALVVASAAVLSLIKRRDVAYGLTVLWALTALAGAHKSPLIRYLSITCIVVLLLLIMFSLMRGRRGRATQGLQLVAEPGDDDEEADEEVGGEQQALLSARSDSIKDVAA